VTIEAFDRVHLDGTGIDRITEDEVVAVVRESLARGRGGRIITPNVDILRRASADPGVRRHLDDADLIVADGMPLVWASRLGGVPLPERVAGSSLIWSLSEGLGRDARSVFVIGGAPATTRPGPTRRPSTHTRTRTTDNPGAPPAEGRPAVTLAAAKPGVPSAADGPGVTSAAPRPVVASAAGRPGVTSAAPRPVVASAAGRPGVTSAPRPVVASAADRPGVALVAAKPGVASAAVKPGVTAAAAKSGVMSAVGRPDAVSGVVMPVAGRPGVASAAGRPGVALVAAKPVVASAVVKPGVTAAAVKAALGAAAAVKAARNGGKDGAARAAGRLAEAFPGLRIAGTLSPAYGFEEDESTYAEFCATVVAARPDLVFVGLGFPKQELVIERLRPGLPNSWFVGCGAAVNFVAGDIERAPLWMQRTGLEWAHRLGVEPRRLAGRYLRHDAPYALRLLARAPRRRARRR
jgi:exopolysaccharide biosynthesis WecB/TagA/CpsF family protein